MAPVRVLRQFTRSDLESVRDLADAVARATGVAPFGSETWAGLEGRSALGDIGLRVDADDGSAHAYAHLAHHHRHEWSLEIAALDRARSDLPALVGEAVAAVAAAGGGHVTLWAHGATGDADDLAGSAGFAPERDLLQMMVPLPLTAQVPWPEEVKVRAFVVGEDEGPWVKVNNRAFADHPEQGNWTIDTIRQREAEPWFDPEGFLLAFDHRGMAGFCWTKVHEPEYEPGASQEPVASHETERLGEIYVVGADPRWQGRGLGRALTAGGLQSLAERGIATGMLYVDGANQAAVGLYRALGFTDHRVDRAFGRDVTAGFAP